MRLHELFEAETTLQGGTPEASERAREQGYNLDMPLYRGMICRGSEVTDFAKKGRSGKHIYTYGPGVYFSTRPSMASNYAGEEYAAIRGGVIIPCYARGKLADLSTMEKLRYAFRRAIDKSDLGKLKRLQFWLKAQGYTGLIGYGGEVVIFEPKNIRGKFAKFDPAKVGKVGLMEGGS